MDVIYGFGGSGVVEGDDGGATGLTLDVDEGTGVGVGAVDHDIGKRVEGGEAGFVGFEGEKP